MAGFGHIAVGMAAGRLWQRNAPGRPATALRTLTAMSGFAALAMWPDVDTIGFACGVPYGAPFGHRGATHSLAAAVAAAAIVAALMPGRRARAFLFALAVAASHPLLDAMTTGGLGVAFLWPFSTARDFLPFRPIPVAPIGPAILSAHGLHVTLVEVVEFAPLWIFAAVGGRARREEVTPDAARS